MSISKDDYKSLKEIYNHLFYNKENVKEKIKQNEMQAIEIKEYIEHLEKNENEYEIFSPRVNRDELKNRVSIEKDKIVVLDDQRLILENEYNDVLNNCNRLNIIIENIHNNNISEIDKTNKNNIILDIQEMERQRIARDLHDSTVQNLVHLIHKVELCGKYLDKDLVQAKLELMTIGKNIKDIINDMRNIIFDLRPMEFDDIGLSSAFDKLFSDLRLKTDIEINTSIDNVENLEEIKAISIFHIIQECCNNAIKHSNAKHLNVSLKYIDNVIKINIEDDGIGFNLKLNKSNRNFGITMVRERVNLLMGKVYFESITDKGTSINIIIPV